MQKENDQISAPLQLDMRIQYMYLSFLVFTTFLLISNGHFPGLQLTRTDPAKVVGDRIYDRVVCFVESVHYVFQYKCNIYICVCILISMCN